MNTYGLIKCECGNENHFKIEESWDKKNIIECLKCSKKSTMNTYDTIIFNEELEKKQRKKVKELTKEHDLTKEESYTKGHYTFYKNDLQIGRVKLNDPDQLEELINSFYINEKHYNELIKFAQELKDKNIKNLDININYFFNSRNENNNSISIWYNGRYFNIRNIEIDRKELEVAINFFNELDKLKIEYNNHLIIYKGKAIKNDNEITSVEKLEEEYEKILKLEMEKEIAEEKEKELNEIGLFEKQRKWFINYDGVWLGGLYNEQIDNPKEYKKKLIEKYEKEVEEHVEKINKVKDLIKEDLEAHFNVSRTILSGERRNLLILNISVKITYKNKLIYDQTLETGILEKTLREEGFLKK